MAAQALYDRAIILVTFELIQSLYASPFGGLCVHDINSMS